MKALVVVEHICDNTQKNVNKCTHLINYLRLKYELRLKAKDTFFIVLAATLLLTTTIKNALN